MLTKAEQTLEPLTSDLEPGVIVPEWPVAATHGIPTSAANHTPIGLSEQHRLPIGAGEVEAHRDHLGAGFENFACNR